MSASGRLDALDWMRGLVMVLMAIDHASAAFNRGRFFFDGALLWQPGTELAADQFLTRWITHLCAPTFVFLAGASLALSFHRRLEAGDSAGSVDGFHLRRGLFIALLDPLWMTLAFRGLGHCILQVMYALGVGMMCMVPLRRLRTRWVLGLGLLLLLGQELFAGLLLPQGQSPSVPLALLLTGGRFAEGRVLFAYPLLPWLGLMCVGWAFGRYLVAVREGTTRLPPVALLAGAGGAALGLFLLVRGLNGYGNALLYREDGSLLRWLHVSKYPPSLSFAALELGLMALVLAGLWWLQERGGRRKALEPLRLLGQTALFFYLLHAHLLEGAAALLGLKKQLGVSSAYVGAALVVVVLYPACAWYRRYKAAHPQGWLRYV